MIGPMLADVLAQYDVATYGDDSPKCARDGCGKSVDLPKNIGPVFCSTDCLPAPRPIVVDGDGLLPAWKRGMG